MKPIQALATIALIAILCALMYEIKKESDFMREHKCVKTGQSRLVKHERHIEQVEHEYECNNGYFWF